MFRIVWLFLVLFFSINLHAQDLSAKYDSPSRIKFLDKSASKNLQKFGDYARFGSNIYALGITAYNKDGDGAIQFLETLATSQILMGATKEMMNRQRPDGGDLSFPSGHVSSTAAPAAFLYIRYGWKPALPAMIAAGITGFSRINSDRHYISDVIGGTLVSVLSAKLFVKQYKNPRDTYNLVLLPTIGERLRSVGFSASYTF